MDTVEITVDGYFEVLVAVLQSIAFVFEGQVIPKITGALALVYFLILIFRNTIDKREPNPFGEIVLICFLGIMFVGGTSAKLEVRLTQVDNGAVQRFDVVQGVPFIVAFPYYVANRATDLLKQETKDNFVDYISKMSSDNVNLGQSIYGGFHEIIAIEQILQRNVLVYCVNGDNLTNLPNAHFSDQNGEPILLLLVGRHYSYLTKKKKQYICKKELKGKS